MNDHRDFEEMCALAAAGQIAAVDLAALRRHAVSCNLCSSLLADFAQVGEQLFLLAERRNAQCRTPEGMTERFTERARREGIPVSTLQERKLGPFSTWRRWETAAAVCLVLIGVAGPIFFVQHSRFAPQTAFSSQAKHPQLIAAEEANPAVDINESVARLSHPRSAVRRNKVQGSRIAPALIHAVKMTAFSSRRLPTYEWIDLRPDANAAISGRPMHQFHYDPSAKRVPAEESSLRCGAECKLWLQAYEGHGDAPFAMPIDLPISR